MIEAGIFDLGGVVVHSGYRSIQREIKRNFGVGDHVMWEILHEAEGDIERGRIKEQEFWDMQSEKFGIVLPVQQAVFEEAYKEEFEVIDGTVDILKRLREKGIRLVALSNTIPSHANIIREAGVFDLFDSVVLSYDTGFRKPEQEVYQIAIERAGRPVEQTIYIDDLPKNVAAANEVGLVGIVFKDPEDLELKIKEFGLII